jgi:aromatic ring-opening dioxygenase catalytic subunit (LigB family)
MSIQRAPALFVPHGGGPMPLLGDKSHSSLIDFLSKKANQFVHATKPKAILVVTAHWETSTPTISSGAKHDLYYDYYGFPAEAFKIKYPAPGSPEVAKRVFELLKLGGFSPKLDDKRGWDHGVFVPLKLIAPEAEIPVVQMSVLSSQNAADHIRMGRALEPLRDEGVAIIGSGMTFHNMSIIRNGSSSRVYGKGFDDSLTDAICLSDLEERTKKLSDWENMPASREAQPIGAAEHFMPLLVIAGAGGNDKGERVLNSTIFNASASAFLWR